MIPANGETGTGDEAGSGKPNASSLDVGANSGCMYFVYGQAERAMVYSNLPVQESDKHGLYGY